MSVIITGLGFTISGSEEPEYEPCTEVNCDSSIVIDNDQSNDVLSMVVPRYASPVDELFSHTLEDFVVADFARELAWHRVKVTQKRKDIEFARQLYRKMKAIEEFGSQSGCLLELYSKESLDPED